MCHIITRQYLTIEDETPPCFFMVNIADGRLMGAQLFAAWQRSS
jgi:hypothetical protein